MAKFIGIDFSGARDAGRKIWIAEAQSDGPGLYIVSLSRADRLLGVSARRGEVLPALVSHIAAQSGAVIGMDFSFSVPECALFARTWRDFALNVESRFAGQDELRDWCWRNAGSREVRRATELAASTPFSAYNRRIKFQTYFGITQVIAPLLRDGAAAFPPMEPHIPDSSGRPEAMRAPQVIEVCPASTIKSLGISSGGYKGRGEERALRRRQILEALKQASGLRIPADIERAAMGDSEGDALDAIAAAMAASRAAAQIASGEIAPHGHIDEGHVFF
jgi:hypothetical protein